jgi:hypothetical protein
VFCFLKAFSARGRLPKWFCLWPKKTIDKEVVYEKNSYY